jgi:hypothetical protein
MHGSSFVEAFFCVTCMQRYRVSSTSDIWHFFAHYLFYLFIYFRKQGFIVSILIFQNFNELRNSYAKSTLYCDIFYHI